MFTLLPSLYIIAVHYIRQWNAPYYYEENSEEETRTSNIDFIHENNLIKPSNDIQSLELISKCDNIPTSSSSSSSPASYCSLQHDKELLKTSEQSTRSNLVKKNGYLSENTNDEDIQLPKVKLSTKKPLRSSSLLNVGRQKTYTNDLSENDIIRLMNETGFTREQILLWHGDFLRDCPDGRLSKAKFIDIYKQFYKKGQVAKFCEHAFRVFDKDGSGFIDFVEFLIAVSMTSTKDPARKTELFFSMYDIDRNGLIDENEMRCVVESIYELMGIDVHDSTRIDMKVQEIFAKAECDQSGYLTKDQFALACKNDRYIRKLLVPNTKAPNHR